MTRIDRITFRRITIGGLLTGAVGLGLAKAGGMEMPVVPPGAVLLVAGAVLVAVVKSRRWPGLVAALIALAEVVPSAITLGDISGAAQTIGSVVRLAGALVALFAGLCLAATRNHLAPDLDAEPAHRAGAGRVPPASSSSTSDPDSPSHGPAGRR